MEGNNREIIREKALSSIADAIKNPGPILLLGKPKSGKTTIVRQFLHRQQGYLPCIVDFKRIPFHPEYFSLSFIHTLLAQTSHTLPTHLTTLLDLKQHISAELWEVLIPIQNELEKVKPNQEIILTHCFSFVNRLAQQSAQPLLLVLENIESFVHQGMFTQVKDTFSLFSFTDPQVRVVFTSSLDSIKDQLEEATVIAVPSFSEEEISTLLPSKIHDKDALSSFIFSKAKDHPFVVKQLITFALEGKDLASTYTREILTADSALYAYWQQYFEFFFSRVRGQGLLQSLVDAVAHEPLRLSDLARRIYRSAPVTKSLLQRLIEVGLIEKKDKTFHISDSLLGEWLKARSSVGSHLSLYKSEDVNEN